ncbi:uncharacterized protein F5147DRAFT_701382 [Suillus discolor]|uniref:Mitochondrial inner membrane protease subunit 2 n=1 Tax=Suillus discolor TaxID=1912936 RepID=A0A9P7F5A1_9AGAM|nr:uncharacterized protein F5147DRAFT_701382 [Suillus discolor]KAG2106200.1 hypothetical protein F5147DRAFT_701382 [Suillus discolor]
MEPISTTICRRKIFDILPLVLSPVAGKAISNAAAVAGDIVKTLPPYPDAEVFIPEGHVWVEGDEPFRTLDNNKFGPVPLALLDSKLMYIIWPLDRVGPLHPPISPISKRAAFEREQHRQSRVIARSTMTTHS